MAEPIPRISGKIVQAIGDDDIKWLRANQNFARIQNWIDQAERFWPVTKISPLGFGLPFLFGDGGLGDVTLSVNTNFSTHDIREYKNLIINSGVTVSTSASVEGMLILYASESLTLDGIIDMDGLGGASGAANQSGTSYTSSYGASGGGGGSDNSSQDGGNGGATIVAGGTAGIGSSQTAPANGSSIGTTNIANLRMRQDQRDFSLISWGGGGGGANLTNGGAGGNGGGGVIIIARTVLINGTITLDGVNGQNGQGGNGGGGGGGGGGFFVCCDS